jgi:cobalamin synthase
MVKIDCRRRCYSAKPCGLYRARHHKSPVAIMSAQDQTEVPTRRWRVWLGMFLLIPLTAASGGMLFGLYRHVATGQLNTVAKSYGATSRTIYFAESPVWFLMTFIFHAAFTAFIIFVTVVVARLVLKRRRPPSKGHEV